MSALRSSLTSPIRGRHALELAGALAPFLLLAGSVFVSWLEQDFMEALGWDVWPSGLALGPRGWLQVVTFVAVGLLLEVFALGVYEGAKNAQTKIAAGLFGLSGIGMLLLAFKTDPEDWKRGMASFTTSVICSSSSRWSLRTCSSGSGYDASLAGRRHGGTRYSRSSCSSRRLPSRTRNREGTISSWRCCSHRWPPSRCACPRFAGARSRGGLGPHPDGLSDAAYGAIFVLNVTKWS